jgi:uncharacterized protein (TIGR01777 family)
MKWMAIWGILNKQPGGPLRSLSFFDSINFSFPMKRELIALREKIILAGGSGFLGLSLAQVLIDKGYQVVILTRGRSQIVDRLKYVHWDGRTAGNWVKEINGSKAVVNFTGKSVDCIYTEKNKREILNSRLDSVNVLHEAIQCCTQPPEVFIQAGSLAIYGDTRDLCNEDAPHGTGFSVQVCQEWENAFYGQDVPHVRKVLLRIGFALGREGGALEPLKKLTGLNLGGTIGSGQQYISWLHIDDLNQMFVAAIEDDQFHGTYNATGPQPIINREFMKALRTAMGKGWSPPAPSLLVRLGAYVFMRAEPELALTGRNCAPKRLLDQGFIFQYPELNKALEDLIPSR